MVEVEVRVAERVHEFAGLVPGRLRHHQREERVGSDIEGHAEEDVGAALIELARQAPVRNVELEEGVAGCERHARNVGDVPGRDHQAA